MLMLKSRKWLRCALPVLEVGVLVLCITAVSCQPDKPVFTANDEIDEDDLKCAACLAIVDLTDKEMSRKSFDGIESRVYELMDTLCDQSNFKSYDFIPPKMAKACKTLIDKIGDEELISTFTKYYSTSSHMDRNLLERKICLSLTGECIGNNRLEDVKIKPSAEEAVKEDKHFSATVEELMKEHGHKIKQPQPVKHNDEL